MACPSSAGAVDSDGDGIPDDLDRFDESEVIAIDAAAGAGGCGTEPGSGVAGRSGTHSPTHDRRFRGSVGPALASDGFIGLITDYSEPVRR